MMLGRGLVLDFDLLSFADFGPERSLPPAFHCIVSSCDRLGAATPLRRGVSCVVCRISLRSGGIQNPRNQTNPSMRPNCYEASGWRLERQKDQSLTLAANRVVCQVWLVFWPCHILSLPHSGAQSFGWFSECVTSYHLASWYIACHRRARFVDVPLLCIGL